MKRLLPFLILLLSEVAAGQTTDGRFNNLYGRYFSSPLEDASTQPFSNLRIVTWNRFTGRMYSYGSFEELVRKWNENALTYSITGVSASNGLISLQQYNGAKINGVASGNWNINAATVTNGVYTNGTYNNPPWLTGLAWAKIQGAPAFLLTETDPTVAAHIKAITSANLTQWNAAVPGTRTITINGITHNLEANRTFNVPIGITSETDPTVPAHVKGITTQRVSNWDAAHNGIIISGQWQGNNIFLETNSGGSIPITGAPAFPTSVNIGTTNVPFNRSLGLQTIHGLDVGVTDVRDAAITPNDLAGNKAGFRFTNTLGGAWRSYLYVSGWAAPYATWRMIGPANTGNDNQWFLQAGTSTTWGPQHEIWHTGNITPVPTSRSLTINGETKNLSMNQTWNLPSPIGMSFDIPTGHLSIQRYGGAPNVGVNLDGRYLRNISGLVLPGTNMTRTGNGTPESPYVFSSTSTNTGVSEEADPIFVGHPAYNVTVPLISQWNNAVPQQRTITINGVTQDLYGNREWNITTSSGGITTETDPTVPSFVKSITSAQIGQWNTAYGWGNHAGAGYVPQARYITINGVSQDLSANREWNITTGSGGITSESDPTVPAFVKAITQAHITQWNNALQPSRTISINGVTQTLEANRTWNIPTGLTSETDPEFSVHVASGITQANLNAYNLAAAKWTASGSYIGNGVARFIRNDNTTYDVTGFPTGAGTGDISGSGYDGAFPYFTGEKTIAPSGFFRYAPNGQGSPRFGVGTGTPSATFQAESVENIPFYRATRSNIVKWEVRTDGNMYSEALNDNTAVPKMVTSTNGVLGTAPIPTPGNVNNGAEGSANARWIFDQDYAVEAGVTHVLFTRVITPRTLILPDPAANVGRKIVVKHGGGGTAIVNVNLPLWENSSTYTMSISNNRSHELISDGQKWWQFR